MKMGYTVNKYIGLKIDKDTPSFYNKALGLMMNDKK